MLHSTYHFGPSMSVSSMMQGEIKAEAKLASEVEDIVTPGCKTLMTRFQQLAWKPVR